MTPPSGARSLRRDLIRAASRAFDEMLDAGHGHAGTQQLAEQLELGTAEAAADAGGATDRAVVFDQKVVAAVGDTARRGLKFRIAAEETPL